MSRKYFAVDRAIAWSRSKRLKTIRAPVPFKRLNGTGARVVFSLFDRDQAVARSTAKYFLDMQAVAHRCFGLLRRSGMALFVIGNTEYKGVRIDNASHLAEALLSSGFRRIRVAKRRMSGKILTPYRDSLGQFSGRRTGRHVYA